MRAELHCAAHEDVAAIAACRSCGRGLCSDCWTDDLDDKPACAACIAILTRPMSLLVPIVGVPVSTYVVAVVLWRAGCALPGGLVIGCLFGLLAALTAERRIPPLNARRAARQVQVRRETAPTAVADAPYRGTLARSARRLAPPLAGTNASALVAGALALSAASALCIVALPAWLTAELVLTVWWGVWTVALALLLHRGWRIADDGIPPKVPPDPFDLRSKLSSWFDREFPDLEDYKRKAAQNPRGGNVFVGTMGFIGSRTFMWPVTGVLFPASAEGIYRVVFKALSHVANRLEDCEGRAGRALGRGAAWALVYTLPLAIIVALVRLALR